MQQNPIILILNSGSSSIKFALYSGSHPPRPLLTGAIERIGLPPSTFQWHEGETQQSGKESVQAPTHSAAAALLMDWLDRRPARADLAGVGHRVVHGGPKYDQPQRVTPELLEELRRIGPYDPEHFPAQFELIQLFQKRYPKLPQITCFDTAFHQSMPRVAKMLPLPRKYEAAGLRRYGFHGLSYEYLVGELERLAGAEAARGRLVLAHLGNGASMAAVRDGHSMDTTMAFTPTAGLPMSTRTGDVDPGIFLFLARTEKMTTEQFQHLVNYESGLRGVSETSSDMRDLLAREAEDPRAAEAVALFCYQAKKWIGALAAALGGLDTLVFAGGIGENAQPVRARICQGLDHLGISLDEKKNEANTPVISAEGSRATVRVIRTNEEVVMARSVWRLLGPE
jgi:acetate kinase